MDTTLKAAWRKDSPKLGYTPCAVRNTATSPTAPAITPKNQRVSRSRQSTARLRLRQTMKYSAKFTPAHIMKKMATASIKGELKAPKLAS